MVLRAVVPQVADRQLEPRAVLVQEPDRQLALEQQLLLRE